MNTELLLKVKEKILAEPRQFDMRAWFLHDPKTIPNCGTAACIAGWAVTLANNTTPVKAYLNSLITTDVETEAAILLDLQARLEHGRLFHIHSWPIDYRNRYINALNAKGRAKVAAEYIDYFIAQDGKV